MSGSDRVSYQEICDEEEELMFLHDPFPEVMESKAGRDHVLQRFLMPHLPCGATNSSSSSSLSQAIQLL